MDLATPVSSTGRQALIRCCGRHLFRQATRPFVAQQSHRRSTSIAGQTAHPVDPGITLWSHGVTRVCLLRQRRHQAVVSVEIRLLSGMDGEP